MTEISACLGRRALKVNSAKSTPLTHSKRHAHPLAQLVKGLAVIVPLTLLSPAFAKSAATKTTAAKPAAGASANSGVLMTINGKAIPMIWENVFLAEQQARGQQDSPELRSAVKDEITRRVLIADEARKRGLDKQADVAAQMEMASQAVLIRAFVTDFVQKTPITDEEIKKEYDQVNSVAGSIEYQVRHILVKTEDEAKAIIDKLKAGESFSKLAAQSIDTGSREKGGELGWSIPATFVEPFANEMKKLEKGQYSQVPVKTEFGYHVIQLDDKRNLTPPALEDVRAGIERRIREKKLNQYLQTLREKAKIN